MQTTKSEQRKPLPAATNHIDGLDGLRGIAVVGVVLYHLFPDVIKGGFLGVSLFFVLSGYLMAVTSENSSKYGGFDVLKFYKKRLWRIYPSLIIVVFVALGLLKIIDPAALNGIREEIGSIFLGFNNFWQISQNSSYFTKIANTSLFTHLWSLSIELQFYLIWPGFFLLYKQLNKSKFKNYSLYVFIIPAVISIIRLEFMFQPGQDVTRVYYSTGTRIFSLFMGAFLGLCERRKRVSTWSYKRRKKAIDYFGVLIILVVLSYVLIDGQSSFTYRIGLIGTSILFCELLKLAVNPNLPIGKWLDCRPLSCLGKKSYEIYLWQYPVIFIFRYLKWDWPVISPLMICTIIFVLATWLQEFLNLMTKKIRTADRDRGRVRKIAARVLTLFLVFAFVLGGYSAATVPNTKKESQKKLQEELERNAQELMDQQKQAAEAPADISLDSLTIVGDSVMLGAVPSIQKALPNSIIDAKESRQVEEAGDIVNALDGQGMLGKTVIIALGTNGTFSLSSGQKLIDRLGSDRTIFWTTVYGAHLQWQDETNKIIWQLAENNKNVHVIDWAETASAHPEWFYEDGIHLNTDGQEAYANFIVDSIS